MAKKAEQVYQLPFAAMLPESNWTPPKVSELPSWAEAKRVAFDVDTYEITVLVVQKDQGGTGYAGDGADVKGITAMVDDFRDAIRVNTFGVFRDSASITDVDITAGEDRSGFVWAAWFTITGEVVTQRNA